MLTELLVAGLAASQIIEIWLDGSIFKPWQDSLAQAKRDKARAWPITRAAELLTCAFCLMPWTSLGTVAVLLATPADSWWRLPCYAFAAARIGHLANDVRARFSEPAEVDETDAVEEYMILDDTKPATIGEGRGPGTEDV